MEELIQSEQLEVQSVSVTEAQSRAEIDIQISTANRFPRNVDRSIQNIIAIVSKDKDLAEKCVYSLPRAGKEIKGVSVHLARLIASEYKNMRVQCCIVDIGNTMITAQATAHDVQTNYAVRTEVKRKITDKRGQRYNEDMIVMTCNAALAVAERNAILKVIPATVINKVYQCAQQTIIGDLTDEQKLIKRRTEVLEGFHRQWNVSEEEILNLLELETINQIKHEQILTLVGLANAIVDGDTTVKEAFSRTSKSESNEQTKQKVQDVIKKAQAKRAVKKTAPTAAQQTEQSDNTAEGNLNTLK